MIEKSFRVEVDQDMFKLDKPVWVMWLAVMNAARKHGCSPVEIEAWSGTFDGETFTPVKRWNITERSAQ